MTRSNSTLKPQPNITPILRKSPRLLLRNQLSPLDPKTPKPELRARRICSDPSPVSSVGKGFPEKVSGKIQELKCGLRNLGKLNNGFVGSGVVKDGFCVRRSPRLYGRVNGIDDFLENGVSSRKKGRALSNLGQMEVGYDSGRQDEGKSGMEKRVTRSSVWENTDETIREKTIYMSGLPDEKRAIVDFELGKKTEGGSAMEKRVTQGLVGGKTDEITKKRNECRKGLSDTERAAKVFEVCKRAVSEVKIEKRVTRGSIQRNADEITKKKNKGEEGLLDLLGAKSCNRIGGKFENHVDDGADSCVDFRCNLTKKLTCSCEAPSRVIHTMCVKETNVVKRKRNQDGENHGWTQDQELALQRAYFAAKPTPNFWKKVAKLVPGKSAHDCFNKVHADNLTPPQRRLRSRAANRNMSSFSLSASKLLKPENLKIGKIASRKQKGHLAQKTVRQLLQKHYDVDQGYEADLFSVLESTFKPSTKSPECGVSYSTPQHEKGSDGLLKVCHDKSSSALTKPFSRLCSSSGPNLVSPPVLKPIKNKALHEKYIDQLHCREAKRKTKRAKENPKNDFTHKTEGIKEVKDALFLDAKDFILKFQHGKDSATKEYSDDDDENEALEEDGEDYEF